MSPQDRWTIRDAAAILESYANELRRSQTLGPSHEWPDDGAGRFARYEYDRLMKHAGELLVIADRRR